MVGNAELELQSADCGVRKRQNAEYAIFYGLNSLIFNL